MNVCRVCGVENYDIRFIVDFPGNTEAMKASINISKATEIGFRTLPAIPVDEFDKAFK